MKIKLSFSVVAVLAFFSVGSLAAEEHELIPSDAKTPYVFASRPNEFAGKPDARSFGFAVDGAKRFADLPALGKEGAVKLRVRATDPQTDALEITLHQSDGRVWGCAALAIDDAWTDVLLPFAEMKYFSHWGNLPPKRPDDLPNEKLLTTIRFCYGA